MKEEERRTSFLGCFDGEEKKVAEILRQFPELVIQYEYNRGILPFWGPKRLRSVLVNIPLPFNRPFQPPSLPSLSTLQCTDCRPVSNALPSIPESLPSSSKPHSANTRSHPKKKSPNITLKKKKQQLRIFKDEAIEEITMEHAVVVEPQFEWNNIPEDGGASHLVEEDGSDVKESEGRLYRERQPLLEYRIGTDMSNGFRPFPDGSLIPTQTLVMGYCIQPIQLGKEAIYAEARRRRKLEMQRVKSSKRPRT